MLPPFTHVAPVQVDEVKSDEVICTSHNSAQLDGLLTVFHTERSADSLQNIQNDLPILTEYDKKVSAHSRKACLIRDTERLEGGTLCPPSQAARRAFEGKIANISCGTFHPCSRGHVHCLHRKLWGWTGI